MCIFVFSYLQVHFNRCHILGALKGTPVLGKILSGKKLEQRSKSDQAEKYVISIGRLDLGLG
jgi:hypothetical protein